MEKEEAALGALEPEEDLIAGGLCRGIDEVASNVTYITKQMSSIETGASD